MITTLYVGNVAWTMTDQDLTALVAPYAQVKGSRIIVERETGRSRGFGFVEIDAEHAAKAILALNGTEVGGRTITVNEAQGRPR